MPQRAIDDVADALDGDVEHEIGLGVEELGPVDEREMADQIHAFTGAGDGGRIADVSVHVFEAVMEIAQASGMAARIVVEHADADSRIHEAPRQRAAEKPGPAGDEKKAIAHIRVFPPMAVAAGIRTATAGRAVRRRCRDRRSPHMNQRRYSAVHGPSAKVERPP